MCRSKRILSAWFQALCWVTLMLGLFWTPAGSAELGSEQAWFHRLLNGLSIVGILTLPFSKTCLVGAALSGVVGLALEAPVMFPIPTVVVQSDAGVFAGMLLLAGSAVILFLRRGQIPWIGSKLLPTCDSACEVVTGSTRTPPEKQSAGK